MSFKALTLPTPVAWVLQELTRGLIGNEEYERRERSRAGRSGSPPLPAVAPVATAARDSAPVRPVPQAQPAPSAPSRVPAPQVAPQKPTPAPVEAQPIEEACENLVVDSLLTRAEQKLYAVLVRALPEHRIQCQVSLAALVSKRAAGGRDNLILREQFAQHIADFVVCDAQWRPLLVVELDDCTHNAERDAHRDTWLAQAGLGTLRFDARCLPTALLVQQAFGEALN